MSKVDKKSDDASALHTLSRVNGSINKMSVPLLHHHLRNAGLSYDGCKLVLNRRLKEHYKRDILTECSLEHMIEKHSFPYYIIIDFEATCDESEKQDEDYLHEIIEFPAVLCCAQTGKIVDTFHSYCKPTSAPVLSDFCRNLTGITQAQVDSAPVFSEVLDKFEDWLKCHKLFGVENGVAFITDGSSDFGQFLNVQCVLHNIDYPKWARKWINLKKAYVNFYKVNDRRMTDMLHQLSITFEGRLHCGMDDAMNLAKVVLQMISDGAAFHINESLCDGKIIVVSDQKGPVNKKEYPNRVLPADDMDSVLAKFNGLNISFDGKVYDGRKKK